MPLRQLILAAGFAASTACTTSEQPVTVRTWRPSALPAGFSSSIVLRLDGGVPTSPGLSLWAADGSQAASINCETSHAPASSKYVAYDLAEVSCPTPALAAGTYSMRFSSDGSCGPESYKLLGNSMDVIEPAHVTAISPEHGPADAETTIKVTGSNIGGPHVYCRFTFPPGPGAKSGCDMTESSAPAKEVTPTSVVCEVPKWSGPVQQYMGDEGFKPAEGAVCSREAHLRISNDARVESQEPIVFHYEDSKKEVAAQASVLTDAATVSPLAPVRGGADLSTLEKAMWASIGAAFMGAVCLVARWRAGARDLKAGAPQAEVQMTDAPAAVA